MSSDYLQVGIQQSEAERLYYNPWHTYVTACAQGEGQNKWCK